MKEKETTYYDVKKITAVMTTEMMALALATGKTWIYDKESDTYYPVVLKEEENKTEVVSGNGKPMPGEIVKAWKTLEDSGIFNTTKYSFGNIPDVQGKENDPTEYICQNYAIDAVNKIKETGRNAYVIAIIGHYTDNNKVFGHAIIGIEDKTKRNVYVIDPTAEIERNGQGSVEEKGKQINDAYKNPMNYEPKTVSAVTLVDPQTGLIGATGYEIVGTKMRMGKREYIIDAANILGGNIEQKTTYSDEFKENMTEPISEEGLIIAEADETSPFVEKYGGKYGELALANPWFTTGMKSKVIKTRDEING
jgi:hypothetical protein